MQGKPDWRASPRTEETTAIRLLTQYDISMTRIQLTLCLILASIGILTHICTFMFMLSNVRELQPTTESLVNLGSTVRVCRLYQCGCSRETTKGNGARSSLSLLIYIYILHIVQHVICHEPRGNLLTKVCCPHISSSLPLSITPERLCSMRKSTVLTLALCGNRDLKIKH
jgi:hypothetical protein